MEKQSLLFESGVHSKDQIMGKLVKKNEERERKKEREREKKKEKREKKKKERKEDMSSYFIIQFILCCESTLLRYFFLYFLFVLIKPHEISRVNFRKTFLML